MGDSIWLCLVICIFVIYVKWDEKWGYIKDGDNIFCYVVVINFGIFINSCGDSDEWIFGV